MAPAPDALPVPDRCVDAPRAALAAVNRPARTVAPSAPVCRDADLDRPRFGAWFNRSRRVLLTLAAVWVISIFDLGYTLAESGTGSFVELNPVAAHMLGGPVRAVMAFKFGLLGFSTLILLALRRYAIAELACWFLFASKLYVAARWYNYFGYVLDADVGVLFDINN